MRTNRLLFRKLSFPRRRESSVFYMFCNAMLLDSRFHGNDGNGDLSYTAFTIEDNLVLKSGHACLKSFKFQQVLIMKENFSYYPGQ